MHELERERERERERRVLAYSAPTYSEQISQVFAICIVAENQRVLTRYILPQRVGTIRSRDAALHPQE